MGSIDFVRHRMIFFYFACFMSLFLLLNFRNFYSDPALALDSSWILALNWAKSRNMQWGKDFIWTYGPMFYILRDLLGGYSITDFSSHIFLGQIIRNLSWAFFASCSVFFFFRRTKNKIQAVGLACIVLFSLMFLKNFTELDVIELLMILMIQTCYISEPKLSEKPAIIFIIALLLSIGQLTKVSYFAISIYTLIWLALFSTYRKKFSIFCSFSLFYLLCTTILWVLHGQDLVNFPAFIKGSI